MKIYTPGMNLVTNSQFYKCLCNQKHIDNITSNNGLYAIFGYNGNTVYSMDLTVQPHLLVVGCTGSGKSVALHCIINSLLSVYTGKQFKFVMIDPKRVELNRYTKIWQYMLYPVVTDCNKAANTMEKLVAIMEKRYKIMMKKGLRNYDPILGERIVCIIDEYAELIMQYKSSVETPLTRLAQLGRACGIHLILCTQRPDSKVFSGLLKANIPSRLCLKVSSGIDSRIVIDQTGGELLKGKGDCLYKSDNGLIHLQIPYIPDNEIDSIIKWYTTKQCRGK